MLLASRLKEIKDDIIDIILVKNDVTEIYVLLEKENEKTTKQIKKIAREEKGKAKIEIILVNDLLYNPNIKKIIYSGLSLKRDKKIPEMTNSKPKVIVTYSLESLNHSRKTLFGYAMKGRENEKGLLGELKGSVVGRNSVIVPYENIKNLEEFLKYWKVNYEKKKCLFVENENRRKI